MAEPRAYYNEHDKFAAAWLRNLIAANLIAPGDVDERDIRDVRPSDLNGYRQCHFFAGIGIWSHGLRRAGWPDRRPVWTWSEPCQPFSAAGRGAGFADERYLRPHIHHLVRAHRPPVCFGEQVASKDGLAWLDVIQSDMEGEDYAFGAFDLCAAGFGAPHIRQRLYWLADTANAGQQRRASEARDGRDAPRFEPERLRDVVELADSNNNRFQGRTVEAVLGTGWRQEGDAPGRSGGSLVGGLDDVGSIGRRAGRDDDTGHVRLVTHATSNTRGLANTDGGHASAERQQRGGQQRQQQKDGRSLSLADASDGQFPEPGRRPKIRNGYGPDRQNAPTGPVNGVWRNADWLLCRDDKWRPVESGTFPLAHGDTSRVGRLRAYGNAIVAAQAEEFIGAYLDTEHLRLTEGVFA